MKKPICVNVDGENYISLGSKRKKMCYGCAAHSNQDLCRMLDGKLDNGSDCISLEIIFINDVRKVEVEALKARIAELGANAARNLQDSAMVRDVKIENGAATQSAAAGSLSA